MFSTIGYYISLPFAWLLRALYGLTNSYGLSLILFSLVVKIVLLPFQLKSKKSMLRLNKSQAKMKEIQEKYKNNQQKMNEELQLFYAQEGINPMSGCLWSFLPLPIMLALYSIIRQPLSRLMMLSAETVEKIRSIAVGLGYAAAESSRTAFYEEINLAKFVSENFSHFTGFDGLIPMNFTFLGIDLTALAGDVWKDFFTGGWPVMGLVLIPIVSAALTFFQSKVAMAGNPSGNDAAGASGRMMMYMMPLMMLWFGFTIPVALSVYWTANSVFQILQDLVLNKKYTAEMEFEESEKERIKREERVARMMAARERQREYQEQMNQSRKPQQKKQADRKSEKKGSATSEAGRIGNRPYARGRAYDPEHYGE